MPVWLVEIFGYEKINTLFWFITLSAVPFWLIMLVFPKKGWAKILCNPWLVPPLLVGIYIYTFYLLVTVTNLPDIPDINQRGIRHFWGHPFLFMSLWTHRVIMDLFCGMMMYRYGQRFVRHLRWILVLTWISGPIGLAAYAAMYWRQQIKEPSSGGKGSRWKGGTR